MADINELSDMEILERIGNNFKTIRLLMDISQERLAKITGISRTTIVRFEKGEPISIFYLVKILRGLRKLNDLEKLFLFPGYSDVEMRIMSGMERKRASRK